MLLLDTQPFAKFYSPHVLAEVVAGAGIRLFRAGLTSRELCILQMYVPRIWDAVQGFPPRHAPGHPLLPATL